MVESFAFFDDVVEYVIDAIDASDDFLGWYDCQAIAGHVCDWDDDLQAFVLTKHGNDFWAEVAAHALA